MAKKKSDKQNNNEVPHSLFYFIFKSETTHFVIGLICVFFAVYLLLAFTSFFFTGAVDQSILYHPQQGELLGTSANIKNYAGTRGAQIAEYLINNCFGFASFFVIVFMGVLGMKFMKAYKVKLWKWFICCSVLLIWFSISLAFFLQDSFKDSFFYPGGLHGYNVCMWIKSQIGNPGVILLLISSAILFFTYLTKETINVIRKIVHPQLDLNKEDNKGSNISSDKEVVKTEFNPEDYNENSTVVDFKIDEKNVNNEDDNLSNHKFEDFHIKTDQDEILNEDNNNSPNNNQKDEDKSEPYAVDTDSVLTPIYEEKIEEDKQESIPDFTIEDETTEEDKECNSISSKPYNPRLDLENYKFPTFDLLNHYEDNGPNIDMEEQNANKDRIIKVLRSFGIEISSIKASIGPTITLYEITPAEGVRISKIRNLEDDIALSLSALGIRIIAPIPGKGTIGIEVPNANPKIVPIQSILASKKFQETTFDLPVALGKTITNEVFMVDLAKAPHMLVAGATGQGKSVGLNTIVTSLLYKKHPAELKFVIIDPKKVEFSVYAPIEKHFLAKLPDGDDAIITDVTKVVQTLNSLCVEMDNRYDLLRKAGCRNIKEYNAKFINRQLNPQNGHRFMPYIVVIIDEFGDLIMTAGKEVELPICRIAQLARAIGIHAIIATQRPTTNIITGTIKANFPARVAFRVAAMMDSRTILDRSGAQQLIGKGDMLYLQGNDPVRVQCAFVDTPEVENVANFISKQQGYTSAFLLPEYVSEDSSSNAVGEVDMNRLDPMFEDAARLVIIHQQGSTSLIQRKFSIGYNRAGRIMDQLEKAGIVGPTQGSKARDVLCVDENDLEMRLSNFQK